jgi:hypothetical protein
VSDQGELAPVAVLRIQPGDVLVLTSAQPLTDMAAADIGQRMKELFPDNDVLLLDGGLSLHITRKEGGD